MCSHYQGIKERERYIRHFGVEPPDDLGKVDLWPGYSGSFIRRHPHADVGDEAVPQREAPAGLFGLVPHWSLDTKITGHTYNARSETAAAKPSFREAWKRAQHCIIPAEAFYEPDWRTGKPIPTRIARADGEPMGIAGLWSWWKSPKGEAVHSYTMLTIKADDHPLLTFTDGKCPSGSSNSTLTVNTAKVGTVAPPAFVSATPQIQQPAVIPQATVETSTAASVHDAECNLLKQEIDQIDSLTRQPLLGRYQDELRARREKFRSRQFALHC